MQPGPIQILHRQRRSMTRTQRRLLLLSCAAALMLCLALLLDHGPAILQTLQDALATLYDRGRYLP